MNFKVKYTPEVIQKARIEIDRRRQTAVAVQEVHANEIAAKYPEIYSVYREIRSTASKLSDVVFSKSPNAHELIEKIKDDNLSNQAKLKRMLASFGYSEDYLSVKYHCSNCHDTGTRMGNMCECLEELITKYMVESLNEQCAIKLHSFAEFRLDYYPESIKVKGNTVSCRDKMADIVKFCMDYAKNFTSDSPGLFMIGATGLGKTFLSCCIAQELINKGCSVAFDSVQNYLRAIEKEHFGRAEGDTLELILKADLLILDDLGSEFETSFSTSVIYNIINTRCNEGRPTIISTNIPLQKLTERYDDRIVSRLTGNFKPLRFFGEDIRQIKRRNEDYT